MLAVRVLGPASVTRLSDGVTVATSPRQLAILAYLAIAEPRGPQARDLLASLLWPDADEERARRSLRNALHELRRVCGAPVIVSVGKHQLRLDRALVQCDLDACEARLAADDLLGALEAYRPLLDGFHVRGAEGFERWHEAARSALRTRLLGAVRRALASGAGRTPAEALALLERARPLDPDDERLVRATLEQHARAGDLHGAARAYRAHAERLARDDEGAPSPETTALLSRLAATASASTSATDGTRLTVALVPLTTVEGDAAAAEYGRALDDGVRRRLARRPGVRVVARAALPPTDAATLASWRALNADLVASGTLVRSEGELVIRVEVMRVSDGAAVRELQHRARPDDLFAVEGVMATAVLPVSDDPPEASRLPVPQPPRDPETHLLCLRGHWHFLRAAHVGGSPDDLERSREGFEGALARDPAYGSAYAGLSNYYAVAAARGMRTPFEEVFAHAIALSHRALELDASLAVPHVHFGVRALYLERDWETARREFAEAVRLDPGYAEAHRFLGIVRRALGDAGGGMTALREAVRLEPATPLFRNSLADALLADGALDAAATELGIALVHDPGYRAAAERLVRCHERAARWEEAVQSRARLGAGGAAERFAAALASDGPAGYLAARRHELEAQVDALRIRLTASTPRAPSDRFVPPELALAVALAELGRWDEAWAVESAMPAGAAPWFTSNPSLAALDERRARRKAR